MDDVIQEGINAAGAAKKTGDAADTNVATGIGDSPDDVVRLAADMVVHGLGR